MKTLDECNLPQNIRRFEDLVGLFCLSPLNRGAIRQDIDEAATLFRLVSDIEAPSVLEIGRFLGGSTILLAVAAGELGTVLSIDRSQADDDALRRILQDTDLGRRVTLVTADANEVECSETFDFAIIDGDHSYQGVKRDLNRWAPKVRGYVAFHDMAYARTKATQLPGPAKLREELLRQDPAGLVLDCEVGSMSIWRRTNVPWTPASS